MSGLCECRILRNVYSGAVLLFHKYEEILQTIFPEPPCPIFSFNLPLKLQSSVYEKYPRILSIFLNSQLKIKTICCILTHDTSSPGLPVEFNVILKRFIQPFHMKFDERFSSSRKKRNVNPFVNF